MTINVPISWVSKWAFEEQVHINKWQQWIRTHPVGKEDLNKSSALLPLGPNHPIPVSGSFPSPYFFWQRHTKLPSAQKDNTEKLQEPKKTKMFHILHILHNRKMSAYREGRRDLSSKILVLQVTAPSYKSDIAPHHPGTWGPSTGKSAGSEPRPTPTPAPAPSLVTNPPTFLMVQHAQITLSKFGLTHQVSLQCSFYTLKQSSFTSSTSSLRRETEPLLPGEFHFYMPEMKAGNQNGLRSLSDRFQDCFQNGTNQAFPNYWGEHRFGLENPGPSKSSLCSHCTLPPRQAWNWSKLTSHKHQEKAPYFSF